MSTAGAARGRPNRLRLCGTAFVPWPVIVATDWHGLTSEPLQAKGQAKRRIPVRHHRSADLAIGDGQLKWRTSTDTRRLQGATAFPYEIAVASYTLIF